MLPTSQDQAAPRTLIERRLRDTLQHALNLQPDIAAALNAGTLLFGALPELDSMAVATLLTEIEDRFSIMIDDDDVDGDTFETFGALTDFVARKLSTTS